VTADLAPWEADETTGPMSLAEYDAIRDDITNAYLHDHNRVCEFLTAALSCLGTIAQSGTGVDNQLAASCLDRMGRAARSGVPFGEPQEPAWSLDPELRGPKRGE
jgi:hypothetical protein